MLKAVNQTESAKAKIRTSWDTQGKAKQPPTPERESTKKS
jgi:hypothetical protein